MELLTSVVHHLYQTGLLKTCENSNDYTTYSYEYMGRLVKQPVTVDLRMKRTELLQIVNRAHAGRIADMQTLAMLYNTGYGMPYDRERANLWMRYATMHGEYAEPFSVACHKALIAAQECPETIFPDPIIYPCLDIVDRIHDFRNDAQLRVGCSVLPRLVGVRVYLIYRQVSGVPPHLYAGFYHDGKDYFLDIDKLVGLGAPRYFGEVRDKVTINEYTPFGHNSMYVVAGTIYVPESKRNGDETLDVFHQYLADDSTPLTRAHFDSDLDQSELVELEKTVNMLEKQQERFVALNREFPNLKALKRARKQRRLLKEQMAASNPDAEYQAYLQTRPESRLRFVASELYRWNRQLGLHTVPMGRREFQHLSSLGFYSLTHPSLEFVGWVADHTDVPKTVNMYERALDAKVSSLIVHPGPTATARFIDVTRIDL